MTTLLTRLVFTLEMDIHSIVLTTNEVTSLVTSVGPLELNKLATAHRMIAT